MSFREMRGQPLAWAKASWNGHAERRALLAAHGIGLPETVDGVGGSAPPTDVLDAAAAAWSADRMLRGVARPSPDPPEHDGARAVAIWR